MIFLTILLLIQVGFKEEAKLKDELGFGKDLIVYPFNYDMNFIEKVKEPRKKFI